jgi:hypothetical protein
MLLLGMLCPTVCSLVNNIADARCDSHLATARDSRPHRATAAQSFYLFQLVPAGVAKLVHDSQTEKARAVVSACFQCERRAGNCHG